MVTTLSSLPLSSLGYHTNDDVQEITSGYYSKSDTDQTTLTISENSDIKQPSYISREEKSTFHYASVVFHNATSYPLSPPPGDIPVQHSDIRPDIDTLNVEVILINNNNVHHQLLL